MCVRGDMEVGVLELRVLVLPARQVGEFRVLVFVAQGNRGRGEEKADAMQMQTL